ncbi:hypothetical protein LIER_17998 [Lithospermum erythrorhizon]|uniref:Uncharacterized protein n=1 Tax=Lithospermum erythrorhizon TaxID=34254 RepID=A0AAV3QCG3_LITER
MFSLFREQEENNVNNMLSFRAKIIARSRFSTKFDPKTQQKHVKTSDFVENKQLSLPLVLEDGGLTNTFQIQAKIKTPNQLKPFTILQFADENLSGKPQFSSHHSFAQPVPSYNSTIDYWNNNDEVETMEVDPFNPLDILTYSENNMMVSIFLMDPQMS